MLVKREPDAQRTFTVLLSAKPIFISPNDLPAYPISIYSPRNTKLAPRVAVASFARGAWRSSVAKASLWDDLMQRTGLKEIWPESPMIFMGKSTVSSEDVSWNQSIDWLLVLLHSWGFKSTSCGIFTVWSFMYNQFRMVFICWYLIIDLFRWLSINLGKAIVNHPQFHYK